LKHLLIDRPERSARIGFAANRLNRLSDRRDDPAFIDLLRRSEDARSLVLASEVPILKFTGDEYEALFTFAEVKALGSPREEAFLGQDGNCPLFATLIEDEAPENAQGRDDIVKLDLRSIATQGLLAPGLLGALAQAKSVMHWHSRHRFCSNCGAPSRVTAAGWRRTCDVCKAHHFPRTDPVVIMMVVDGDNCLLGRPLGSPANMYTCLAGFIEAGETCEDAVRREIYEETGIIAGRVDYVASQPWPFPASLMIGCVAQAESRAVAIDRRELEDARWFNREEVALMLAKAHPAGLISPPRLAIANHLIEAWTLREIH
jgi:NAD+ diphosphatase